ncbi:MAG: hypothetical protein OQK24_02620 [Magnetovibrio sp.]|nr:hypothetical protein [Magnetovibrio sp.]
MREKHKLPELVKFLLKNAAIGFGLAVVFVAALMIFDVNGLRTLIWASDIWLLALFILTFFTGLTFGSVQIGVAVMLLGENENDHDDGPRHGTRFEILKQTWAHIKTWLSMPPTQKMAPVPIKVNKPKR